MRDTKRMLSASFGLGLVSLTALGFSVLALIDIFQGGEDLTLELWIVRVGLLVILSFHVLALVVLARMIRPRLDARGE